MPSKLHQAFAIRAWLMPPVPIATPSAVELIKICLFTSPAEVKCAVDGGVKEAPEYLSTPLVILKSS